MGDPKFSRRKYVTPSHPWQGERIEREKELTKKYGLKNKTELWKVQSLLRTFRKRARELQALVRYEDKQAGKEMEELLKRLNKLGLLGEEATLNDVLVLDAEALLSRRLQTMAYLKGLSYSQKHARQLVVHGHIAIGGKRVTVPGYFVKRLEEEGIDYIPNSPLANELHPARPKDELDEGEGPIPTHEKSPEPMKTDEGSKEKAGEPKTETDKPGDKPDKEKEATEKTSEQKEEKKVRETKKEAVEKTPEPKEEVKAEKAAKPETAAPKEDAADEKKETLTPEKKADVDEPSPEPEKEGEK